MSRYKQTACPECNSSDAFTIYEDGAYCFSCQYSTKKVNIMNDLETVADNKDQLTLTDISELNSFAITSRGISKQVVDHFGIKMAVNPDGSGGSHFYPYTANGKVTVVAYKERKLPKNFIVHGNFNNIELFGQSVASGW